MTLLYRGHRYLQWTGDTTAMGGRVYRIDVRDDRFVHFTTLTRAVQIMDDGVLLMDPPHRKFGTDTVNAVSTLYGQYVPGVQTTHIEGDDLAAVSFTTPTVPKYGFVDETVWETDVRLQHPDLISVADAVSLINASPAKLGDDDMVVYK